MTSLKRSESSRLLGLSLPLILAMICFLVLLTPAAASAATGSIKVTPAAAPVGSKITVSGTGLPPNVSLNLQWTTQNASWTMKAIPTPQVTGVAIIALNKSLGTVQTNASGSFSLQTTVPQDYGGAHAIQAYFSNGTALPPVNSFTVVPNWKVSSSSGPAGSPIRVTGIGLGVSTQTCCFHLYWDNSYVGYATGVTTGGIANFTFYASGEPGRHFISIYFGYPGQGYFNPQEGPGAGTPVSASVYYPPYMPFFANYTVTGGGSSSVAPASFQAPGSAIAPGSLAILAAALAGGAFFISRKEPEKRDGISRALLGIVIIGLVAIAGIGVYVASMNALPSAQTSSSSASQTSTSSQVSFTPVSIVVRPQISVLQSGATTGPRISLSPSIAQVGQNITIKGAGFAPGSQLPLVYTTEQGSNIRGYKLVNKPLLNVTAGQDGSFSTNWKIPPILGGIHYIAAGNLTRNSNGTLYVQRTATISATQGPVGTKIQIILRGVSWSFNTNIAAFDYDNSYIGYGCGFNSQGNVTFTIPATGAPGVHTIDVYPSVWWGPSVFANQQPIEYRYPLLTPQDHPELMPSFHFTFLVTP